MLITIRASIAVLLYQRLAADTAAVIFRRVVVLPEWMYLFAGWDSSYYYGIAASWYPHYLSPVWAFFPLYPALTRVVASLGVGVPLAAIIVAEVSGLSSVVVFQIIAEQYLCRRLAACSTILYFSIPPVFIFSGVSYSEPLFLLFSLAAWRYHMTGRDRLAGVAAAFGSLTRTYGFLISVLLAWDYLRKRQFRKLIYAAVPLMCFVGWLSYSLLVTGSLAVMSALHTYWPSEPLLMVQTVVFQFFHGNLRSVISAADAVIAYLYADLFRVLIGLASIALVAFLGYKVLKIDQSLGAYVVASLIVISYFGVFQSLGSFPRYLGFLFPVGLVLGTKRRLLLLFALAILILLDYVAWWAFIADHFY
jgi:hypothetical protein